MFSSVLKRRVQESTLCSGHVFSSHLLFLVKLKPRKIFNVAFHKSLRYRQASSIWYYYYDNWFDKCLIAYHDDDGDFFVFIFLFWSIFIWPCVRLFIIFVVFFYVFCRVVNCWNCGYVKPFFGRSVKPFFSGIIRPFL